MSHLLYSSNEMFSSTELIRKSKMIFDKLLTDEISKAIILRDGKPGFMLLEFAKYETLMKDYIILKEQMELKSNSDLKDKSTKIDAINTTKSLDEELLVEKSVQEVGDITDEDLKKALEDIEKLGDNKKEAANMDEDVEIDIPLKDIKEQPLKEFWD